MDNSKLKIVCLKWGDKYSSEYVNKLYSAVTRHTTVDHEFCCFTENSSGIHPGITTLPLPNKGLDSWWNKLYLFSDKLPFNHGDRIFYIDLDTLIVSNIDHLLNHDSSRLIALRDFYTGLARTVVGDNNMGSGLMAWTHGNYNNIWNDFIRDPRAAIDSVKPHGDQRWIQKYTDDRVYWQNLFPNEVVSFKVHCNSGLPNNAKIVCYHGRPSIPDSASKRNRVWKYDIPPQSWVLKHWR